MPLLQAASEIQTIRNCDTATARQIVKDAHELSDLDLRLRRPDGSTDEPFDRNNWSSPWWSSDLLFENGGLIDAPARPRRGSIRRAMRRVQPMERCRIVVSRESLDAFLKPSAPLRKLAPKKKRRKAKQAPRAGAPEQHDWEEGKLFVMQELKTRGNPLDKNNQTEGWETISDVAKLLRKHLEKFSKDGVAPDLSTARGKVSDWIKKFERARLQAIASKQRD